MAKQMKFHFIKSPTFQEIPAHGAFGGVVPTGDKIAISFYSERSPLPTVVVHALSEKNELGDEDVTKRESKEGIVRTIHNVIYLDNAAAKAVHDWLGQRITEMEKLKK